MDKNSLLPLLQYVIGMYDPYGIGHSERVRNLSVTLAIQAGVERESQLMIDIETAADLHDIGKIGIPENIRRLPGQYLPAERMIMEQHPIIGDRLLRKAANGYINPAVCDIVRHHHEDWGGTGYPDGLKETDIPLGARVIRICDFYDAKTNVRGYQAAMTPAGAIQFMIDKQIEKIWADPDLLRMFLQLVRDRMI